MAAPAPLKPESLAIVDEHATVNLHLSLALPCGQRPWACLRYRSLQKPGASLTVELSAAQAMHSLASRLLSSIHSTPSACRIPSCSGLVDFQNSVLGHADRFEQIQKQLDAGERQPGCGALSRGDSRGQRVSSRERTGVPAALCDAP